MPTAKRYEPHELIEIGSQTCTRIKNRYYVEQPWNSDLANKIARMLSALKKKAKSIYPDYDEKELLIEITKWDDQDFEDIFTDKIK